MNTKQIVIVLVALVIAGWMLFNPPYCYVQGTPTRFEGVTLDNGLIRQVDNAQLAIRLGYVAVAAGLLCLITQTSSKTSKAAAPSPPKESGVPPPLTNAQIQAILEHDREYCAVLKAEAVQTGLDPSLLKDAVIVGAYHVEAGARTLADWTARMREDLPSVSEEYLQAAWKELERHPVFTASQTVNVSDAAWYCVLTVRLQCFRQTVNVSDAAPAASQESEKGDGEASGPHPAPRTSLEAAPSRRPVLPETPSLKKRT